MNTPPPLPLKINIQQLIREHSQLTVELMEERNDHLKTTIRLENALKEIALLRKSNSTNLNDFAKELLGLSLTI